MPSIRSRARSRSFPTRLVAAIGGLALVAAPLTLAGPAALGDPAQTVTDGTTASVESFVAQLVGEGVTTSDIRFTGDPRAIGSFDGMGALGLTSGVALSTGRVAGIPGPHGGSLSTRLDTPGDEDATALAGAQTRDAAILEFDVVPTSTSLSIDYVFGSAEYNKWVGKGYNDVFGFFVNGTNCAVIGEAPVSVDTVNALSYAELFVDNTAGSVDTALNGFTVPLRCVAPVAAHEQNHVKLVIADVSDAFLDSVVLLAAGGVVSNAPPAAADIAFTLAAGSSAAVEFPGTDPDGDELTYAIVSEPAHGTFRSSGSGGVYSPEAGFAGADAFEYTVSDGHSTSGPYRVDIEVVEDAALLPTVSDVHYTAFAGEDTPIRLVASAADGSVPDEGSVRIDVVAEPTHGILSGEGAQRSYRSDPAHAGADSFVYTATIEGRTSTPATVTLDVVTRPVPAITGRTVPVFPPGPVSVSERSRTLAGTGATVEIVPLASLAIGAGVAGAAALCLGLLVRSRRTRSCA
ncbi:choice-of-anchor L domain-containing protein [Leifsonia sp. NPDC056824]|uniref:choice-of-anchor L domain-containing protein n=1 Tax=Leifsonia sp. NPDC056824 TaxID=3345953 RepID=UPI0036829CF0